MQKALLMASVFIGAFLFSTPVPVHAQEQTNSCPFGGTLMNNMCVTPAEFIPDGYVARNYYPLGGPGSIIFGYGATAFDACSNASDSILSLFSGDFTIDYEYSQVFSNTCRTYYKKNTGNSSTTLYVDHFVFSSSYYQCPSDSQPQFNLGPVQHTGENYCYYLAAIPDNDNECPPDTVGDNCPPPDNEEDDECFTGGNGMQICPKDPNEECQSDEFGNLNCPPGCGFVNNQFFCSDEPDSDGEIPDLSDCIKVGNSFACPKDPTPPDDSITDPDKPITDLNKGDLKDSNKGIEMRLDTTNKLLAESNAIGKVAAEGIESLNSKSLAANGKLDKIADNTKRIADGLTSDGSGDGDGDFKSMISGALGITGDESIADLTDPNPISLDQFKSEFQWSGGGGNCPAPRSINVMGKSFSMDWSPFCQAFNVLSYFVLAAAYFFSTIIAFGGKK